MMDYYDELGVNRDASPEEIRRAYKRLVRLLHPDHCGDDQVRQLADLQMKRLNEILGILIDPQERAVYNQFLTAGPAQRELPPPPSGRVLQQYWPAAAAAAFLGLVSLLARAPQSPPPPAAPIEQPAAAPVAEPKKPPRQTRVHLASVTSAPRANPSPRTDVGSLSPPDVPSVSVPEPEREASNSPRLPSPIAEIRPPALPPGEIALKPARPPLAGEWFYVPSLHSKTDGLYPPEYIELRVTEESGIVRGRYRARYHIRDQAISPTVSFQFEGRSGGDGASLPWSGAGGARGEVTLRLVTPGALEVTWVANQLGDELGLISGTAMLVRKLD